MVLVAFPATTFAQSVEQIIRPIPYPWPIPPVQVINVTPGNPVELSRCGNLEVKGRGLARFENFNGSIQASVVGKLAVKKEDVSSLTFNGFNRKTERGNYIVYSGRGTVSGTSQDTDLIVLAKAKIESKGCGTIHLKWRWEGTFQPFWRIYPLPEPEPIPLPLPVELMDFEAETLSN